ncbi:MAG: DUF177 domain-containing protein [Fidelibacterota bacterium]|nr:MAG: DUF177 domain-containing protein [Candidatus Neomarinimicrobiota bacterium]
MKILRGDLHHFEGTQFFQETLFDIGINTLGNPETPVQVGLSVHKQGEDFLLTGEVKTDLTLVCDRCLGAAPYSIEGSFSSWLVSEPRPDLKPGESEVLLFPPHQPAMDLSELIAGAIYIELPQKKLCREDCRGLCPSCGADLNMQSCGCKTDEMDERWSALLAIKEQLKE